MFVLSLVVVAAAGRLTGWTANDIEDELGSSQWERVFGGSLATLVVVVFVVTTVVAGLRRALLVVTLVFGAALAVNYIVLAIASGEFNVGRDVRVIGLLVLLGASMIAGGLARITGGTLSPIAIVVVAMTGRFAAGQAGGGAAGLLVALAKRTLRQDPRDCFAHDLVHSVVARRSTRFVDADLSGADDEFAEGTLADRR